MNDYPRSRNGWIDDGEPVKGGQTQCPNCGSREYRETLSREYCPACGLRCDYWGGGSNKVYMDYLARFHAQREYEEAERIRKAEEEYFGSDQARDEEDF